MNARLTALAVPSAFVLASLAMRAALKHALAHAAANDLLQPVAVVTNWNAYGALLFAALFLALALATAGYLVTLRTLWGRRDQLSIGWIVAIAVAAMAAAWTIPVIFSSDPYAYAAYGEAARLGIDPYARTALPNGNPVFAAAIWQWGNPLPVCVYGPTFVAMAAAVTAALHPAGVTAQIDALRALASLSWLACIPLAYAAFPGERTARAAAAFAIGANPVALWCAVEGHNDALAVAVVLCGFVAMRRGRYALGGAVAALAGTIKLPALAAAAAASTDRRARWGAALGALAAIALSFPVFAGALTQLAPHGRYAPQASFEAIVKPAALLLFRDDAGATALTWFAAAVAAGFCAARGIARLRADDPEGWIFVALAAWLLIPNPYPWYSLWMLPVAALAPQSRAASTALWLSLASLLRYVPDAAGAPSPAAAAALGVAATLPFLRLFRSK